MTKLEMAIYVNLIAKEPLVKMVLKPDREPLVEYIGDIYYSTAYNKQADAKEDLEYLLDKLLLLMPWELRDAPEISRLKRAYKDKTLTLEEVLEPYKLNLD